MGKRLKKTELEDIFANILIARNISFKRQHRITTNRRWRCDFFLDKLNTIVEIEGGQFIKGGHNSISGLLSDIEKYNVISMFGFKLIRFTTIHFEKRGYEYMQGVLDNLQGLPVDITELKTEIKRLTKK